MTAQQADATSGRCGTYAGYTIHVREGIPMCDACRVANRDYIREYRKKNPDVMKRDRATKRARGRALAHLALLHPGQFQILYDQELER